MLSQFAKFNQYNPFKQQEQYVQGILCKIVHIYPDYSISNKNDKNDENQPETNKKNYINILKIPTMNLQIRYHPETGFVDDISEIDKHYDDSGTKISVNVDFVNKLKQQFDERKSTYEKMSQNLHNLALETQKTFIINGKEQPRIKQHVHIIG